MMRTDIASKSKVHLQAFKHDVKRSIGDRVVGHKPGSGTAHNSLAADYTYYFYPLYIILCIDATSCSIFILS